MNKTASDGTKRIHLQMYKFTDLALAYERKSTYM